MIDVINSISLCIGGFKHPKRSHLRFNWWNSMQVISAFGTLGWLFKYLHRISLFKWNINPAPNLLRSRLNSSHLIILNCMLTKVESILDSEIKNISKFAIVSGTISNFFLMGWCSNDSNDQQLKSWNFQDAAI